MDEQKKTETTTTETDKGGESRQQNSERGADTRGESGHQDDVAAEVADGQKDGRDRR